MMCGLVSYDLRFCYVMGITFIRSHTATVGAVFFEEIALSLYI